ncbi:radical SAM protein [Marinisporobacter balticus]|uniref:4Fe-4S single cluster protein n=1 Tax=Marinisporobacter balticus TaxID=2018667 RepID=A0A4R2KRW6_9FIRM|nr:radical SAM protein [Marinisporobacter balticus]TCO76454.1 4Fe-4S single cluster protein [Marinisporobacter balticus]
MNIEKSGLFKMHRCGIIITYRCNLRCKLCTAYSPYYEIPPHFNFEELKKSIDKYFEIVDYVEKFTISGGEPMVHKELDSIISHTIRYSEKIGFIEIITNGTVVPNEKLIDAIMEKRSKIKFLIDDYGKDLSIKVDEISNIFDELKIQYQVRNHVTEDGHCGGWIDFGDFSQKLYTNEEKEKLFEKCAIPQKMKFCFTIKQGEIHPCGPSYRCIELGKIKKIPEEYVDLFEDISIHEKQQRICKMQNLKSLQACAFCNGMCEDSLRFRAAEQLE